jgi:hypothetical protein
MNPFDSLHGVIRRLTIDNLELNLYNASALNTLKGGHQLLCVGD